MTLTAGNLVLANPMVCANTAKGDNKLYSDAKGVVPSLDLRFASQKNLNDYMTGQDLITFSRPVGANQSPGTYIDENGIIQLSSADTPRFDHDPTTGESLGLLIEESRTNEFTNSNPWSGGTGVTWISGQTSPTGGTEAYKMQEDTSTGIHGVPIDIGGYSANYNRIFSVFAKAAGNRYLSFWGQSGAYPGTNSPECIFDLQDGVVAQNTDGGAAGLFTNGSQASIKDFGNGWYRCSVHVNPFALANNTIYLLMGNSAANDSMSFTGNGSNGILLFGLQKEVGSFPTSYIPTTGTALTRSADDVSISGSNFSSWYNQSEGTVFAESKVQDFTATNFPRIASLDRGDGSANFAAIVRSSAINKVEYSVFAGTGQAVGLQPPSTFTSGSSFRAAGIYKVDDFIAAANGTLSPVDTTGSVPTSLTTLGIGMQGNGTLHYNGTIRRLTYFPDRLEDSVLQAITQ